MKIWQSAQISGSKNYFYKNGSTKKKRSYRGDEWGSVRRLVYLRDNFICQECGVKCISRRLADRQKDYRYVIQCHHKIPYAVGGTNDLDNLITLCLSCHSIVEQRNKTF